MTDTKFGFLKVGDQFKLRNWKTQEVGTTVFTKIEPVPFFRQVPQNAKSQGKRREYFHWFGDGNSVVKL